MATDHMYGMKAEDLLRWILRDLEKGSALGIVKDLFFAPGSDDPFRCERYGVTLESPFGAAAGPHTQMAQNLVAAWLTGARYMELKTVQVLDRITVTKPCIDMADEGYNCEWSQELNLDQSYGEYLKAWVLIHVLHDRLFGPGRPGVIFNMSAGYSMEGILSPTVQRFLDRMSDASSDVAELKKSLAAVYPRAAELDIPGRISDNLTISCMHGCPPREVESIALYFVEQRGLNTTLKMNPTLLGAEAVRGILNTALGYAVEVPDIAFEHDIPYAEARRIVTNCLAAAAKRGVRFSVKLTNTLETLNTNHNLPANEKMLYLSGRALHPISISLAAKLQKDFNGELDISFCAGVDALNAADMVACGLSPVTVCSDLLKPGGYGRFAQYVSGLRTAMREAGAGSIEAFITARAGLSNPADLKAAMIKNLESCAEAARAPGSRYAKAASGNPDVKSARPLSALDCFAAPCMEACPAGQHIPAYLERTAAGDMDGALKVILGTNPFPHVLGKMCNQACRKKCMRSHYDEPLRIREIKQCAAECGNAAPVPAPANGLGVAVVGAGPAGLSCAYFLTLAGCAVEVFEAEDKAGGRILRRMPREAERTERDLRSILDLGVQLKLERRIDAAELAKLSAGRDAVYLAVGPGGEPAGSCDDKVVVRRFGVGEPSVVESVGEGRRAAEEILARLGCIAPARGAGRGALSIDTLRVRQSFRREARKALDAESTAAEASRCLQCDAYCGICVTVCPNRANLLIASRERGLPLQEIRRGENGGVRIITSAVGRIRKVSQVVNLGDFCNECGNCAVFCSSAGAPYRDKWRLHLSKASFTADANGFYLSAPDRLEGKRQGRPFSLRRENSRYIYEDARLRAVLDGESLAVMEAELPGSGNFASSACAVEAAVFFELAEMNGLRTLHR